MHAESSNHLNGSMTTSCKKRETGCLIKHLSLVLQPVSVLLQSGDLNFFNFFLIQLNKFRLQSQSISVTFYMKYISSTYVLIRSWYGIDSLGECSCCVFKCQDVEQHVCRCFNKNVKNNSFSMCAWFQFSFSSFETYESHGNSSHESHCTEAKINAKELVLHTAGPLPFGLKGWNKLIVFLWLWSGEKLLMTFTVSTMALLPGLD